MNDDKMKGLRTGIRIAVTALVEIFVGAATNSVLHEVQGGKIAKTCAKAGGFLVGMFVSDKVCDHICDSIDETMNSLKEIEGEVEEEEGE